jgi:FxsC-like protein
MNRVGRAAAASLRTRQGTYFFLSYAHSAPMSEGPRVDTDAFVSEFFKDLLAQVEQRAKPIPGMKLGFFDQQVPLGSDWKAVLAEHLGAAEVFVPLYSPGYFGRSWPMRERESFRERLALSGSPEPRRHIVPVLWTPFPSWQETPEIRQALELGTDAPEYAENGMRALCMLALYRDQYDLILGRLARRIVDLAERSPLGPSPATGLDKVAGPDEVTGVVLADTAFVIVVSAPIRTGLPLGRSAHSYAATSTLWRPFAERQALPVAEYAASTAERLGLPTRIVSYAEAGDLLSRCPAVMLIDPWVAAGPGGVQALRTAVQGLPDWVVPLVVADSDDAQYTERGADLADDVIDKLSSAGLPRMERVGQVKEFVEIMPYLVTEARRQYLKNAPVFPPDGPPIERPRLTDPNASTFLKPGKKTDD